MPVVGEDFGVAIAIGGNMVRLVLPCLWTVLQPQRQSRQQTLHNFRCALRILT